MMADKPCSKCGEVKPLSEYHRAPNTRDGHAARCKACRREDTTGYRIRRREAEKAAENRARGGMFHGC
jgi:hypothetical protein